MKYAFVFALFALAMATVVARFRGPFLLLVWPAISFSVVALAYATGSPSMFGKRPDGRLQPLAVLVLLPYLLVTWATWLIGRLTSRSAPYAVVTPGVLAGRRLLAAELPSGIG